MKDSESCQEARVVDKDVRTLKTSRSKEDEGRKVRQKAQTYGGNDA